MHSPHIYTHKLLRNVGFKSTTACANIFRAKNRFLRFEGFHLKIQYDADASEKAASFSFQEEKNQSPRKTGNVQLAVGLY